MVFLWFSTKSIQFQCPFRSSAWPKNSASRLGAIWIVLAPGGPGGTGPHTKQPEVWNHTLCIENSVKLWIDINDMYVFIHKAMYVFIYVCIHIIYRRYIYIYIHHHTSYIHTTLVCLKTRDTPRLTISSWRTILTMEPKSSRCLDQFRPPVSRFVSQSPCFSACTLLIILCWKWKTSVLRFETTGIWTPLEK